MKINVVTLCSGYDAQCLALERLKHNYSDFDYELVAWAEIDKYAIQAHNALFPQWKDRNMGDITSCDWSKINDNIDLLTYSTPCQSISSAGKQDGLKKGSGTASSIIWSVLNAIDVLRPKYLLMENVKALVSSKFIGDFHEWQLELVKRGYTNFANVLNSRDFCCPQNRERVFMVSILDENASYHFPKPFPLDKRLKDVLEQEVDEKYYLSEKLIKYVFSNGGKYKNIKGGTGICDKEDEVSPTLTAQYYKSSRQPAYLMEEREPLSCAMRGRDLDNPSNREAGCVTGQRLEIRDNIANTITTVQKDSMVLEPQVLTPRRNEYGKQVRKDYESGELKESRHNMQQLEPREDGVCNTITSVQKDNLIIEPKIVQKARGFNKGGEHEISPTISSNSWECNNILIEPKILSYTRDANGKVVDRHLKDVANTIHGGTGGGGNTDSFVVELANKVKDAAEKSRGMELGVSIDEYGNIRVHRNDEKKSGISESVVTSYGSISPTQISARPNMIYDEEYRIRKLTEREVFRLMDVDDADIDKIQAAGISKTRLYCMAGNSICVGVLFHIFRKLFIETENENQQLTLF